MEPILIGTNYTPRSISFAEGFLGPPVWARQKDIRMLVDTTKARKFIRSLLKRGRSIEWAELGLDGDWRENSTTIYDEDGFHKYDSYEGSMWATPILIVYFRDAPNEAYECWKPEKE